MRGIYFGLGETLLVPSIDAVEIDYWPRQQCSGEMLLFLLHVSVVHGGFFWHLNGSDTW